MELETVTEGTTSFQVPAGRGDEDRGPSQAGPGFYNRAMALTRDIGVLLTRVDHPREAPTFLDALAAAGARGLRVANEAPGWTVHLNDKHPHAVELIEQNAKRLAKDVAVTCQDANALLTDRVWGHIDIDPYGSPVPYLPGALGALRHQGVLSLSATDTTALHGVRPKVTRRRYMAKPPPSKAPGWKAAAARLLVGMVARLAAQQDRAIRPLVVFEHQHAIRASLRVTKGAQRADACLDQVGEMVLCKACQTWDLEACRCGQGEMSGPYWLGPLGDLDVLEAMREAANPAQLATGEVPGTLLGRLAGEAELGPFYLHLPEACSVLDVDPPGRAEAIGALREAGIPAARTAFDPEAVAYQGDPGEALDVIAGLRPR